MPLSWITLALACAATGCSPADAVPPVEDADRAKPQMVEATDNDGQTVATMVDPLPAATALEYAGELTQGGWIRGRVPQGTVRATLGDQQLRLAEDGSFFAASDRDSPDSLTLSAVPQSGETIRVDLSISPRAWSTSARPMPMGARSTGAKS